MSLEILNKRLLYLTSSEFYLTKCGGAFPGARIRDNYLAKSDIYQVRVL